MRNATILMLLALTCSASAQSWGVVGGSISKQGSISTIPGGVLPFANTASLGANPGLGPDIYTVFHKAQLRNTQFCGTALARCVDKAQAGGWARVDVAGSDLDIRLNADARVKHTCPRECCLPWLNQATLDQISFDLTLRVDGVPPGTVVNVGWSSRAVLSVFGRHESALEDPIVADPPMMDMTYDTGGLIMTDNLLTGAIMGVIDNPFNMTLTSKILQQADGSAGVFQVVAGTDITIRLTIDEMSALHRPEGAPIGPKPPDCPIGWEDGDGAELFSTLRLRLDSTTPPPLPGVTPPAPFSQTNLDIEFSTDIGSDAELSEMINPPRARPQFDPGDMYVWKGGPLPLGGANGIRDDAMSLGLAGFNIAPEPGVPFFPPLCLFIPVPVLDFHDLDGFDALDFDLQNLIANGSPPFLYFSSNTVFEPDTLLISVDDDSASDYAQCDVPVNSISPGLRTYGYTSMNDEIMELDITVPIGLVPGMPASTTTIPLLDETDLHRGLEPNPNPFEERFDDDIDALDINWTAGLGNFWIFTVDHEASAGFDPGAIYQSNAAGSVGLVAVPSRLGLIPGVDIDALELCWLPGPQGLALAALFSVDQDDPMTPQDESSGLNPGLIYFTFFDNAANEFADWANGDDIDAIAVWHRSVAGTFTPCTGDIADDFGTLPPLGGADGQVSFGDFLALLGLIGPCPGGTPGCTGDIADDFGTLGGDGQVSFGDFLALLGLIGPCP